MATNNNPYFFYDFPVFETPKLENWLSYGGFFALLVSFLMLSIGYLIDYQNEFSPIIFFSPFGLSLILFGICGSLEKRRIAKAIKNEKPKFVKTVRTIITKAEIRDLNPDNEILLNTFCLTVKHPVTQKEVCFYVLSLRKHLKHFEELLNAHNPPQIGSEVTVKLHAVDPDALCLVLYEETSPFLKLKHG